MIQNTANRFAAIDGLRGIAILMVIGLHLYMSNPHVTPNIAGFSLVPLLTFGRSGVSLFFALSGFCLFYPLIKSGRYQPDWINFYIRRALRILPPYWICLIVFGFLNYHTIRVDPMRHILAHITFLHPLIRDTTGSFTPFLWSLGVEEHFYWMFPLFALLMVRRPYAFVAGCAAVSVSMQVYCGYHTVGFDIRLLPLRIIEFACGMFPAILISKSCTRHINISWVVGLFGLFVAPFIHSAIHPTNGWWWGDILLSPCWGCLIYAAVAAPSSLPARALSLKPLVFTGIISYSLYLYNQFMGFVPSWILPNVPIGTPTWWIAAFVSVFATGTIAYYLVEYPCLIVRKQYQTRCHESLNMSAAKLALPDADVPKAHVASATDAL